MTAKRIIRWALGLAATIAVGYGLYLAWRMFPQLLRVIPNPPRGAVADLRLPLEILGLFGAAVLLEWIWVRTFGRWLIPTLNGLDSLGDG